MTTTTKMYNEYFKSLKVEVSPSFDCFYFEAEVIFLSLGFFFEKNSPNLKAPNWYSNLFYLNLKIGADSKEMCIEEIQWHVTKR